MPSILHISDVHFGPPHERARAKAILELAEERRPDLVVIAGDLTQRAKPGQFRQARAFVDGFSMPTLAVPGNHDVPLWRVWERVFVPYGSYARWFSRDLEPVFRDDGLLVIGVNTAHGWTTTEGRYRRRRLAQAAELLEAAPEGSFKIVVAHHPLAPVPRFERQRVAWNSAAAVELFSRAGVDLVLSGHNHQSFVASSEEFYPSGRAPVLLVQSGTATSNRGRGGERGASTCWWIELEAETLLLARLGFSERDGAFRELSRRRHARAGAYLPASAARGSTR